MFSSLLLIRSIGFTLLISYISTSVVSSNSSMVSEIKNHNWSPIAIGFGSHLAPLLFYLNSLDKSLREEFVSGITINPLYQSICNTKANLRVKISISKVISKQCKLLIKLNQIYNSIKYTCPHSVDWKIKRLAHTILLKLSKTIHRMIIPEEIIRIDYAVYNFWKISIIIQHQLIIMIKSKGVDRVTIKEFIETNGVIDLHQLICLRIVSIITKITQISPHTTELLKATFSKLSLIESFSDQSLFKLDVYKLRRQLISYRKTNF